ncbi:Aminomethyltransferase folate-binding domain-containing protein [Stipitochalara longipes BDJ]|nr:Aminomethyltransferase folate-binding domain-containing protein [Stipitochalara longipes BDJ]
MKSRLMVPLLRTLDRPYICTNCLSRTLRSSFATSSSRPYSTSRNPPPPPSAAYARLASRRLISLSGPDSTHYLQGVITANLSPSIPRKSGFYTAFLNAPGRLLNDVFIYPDGKGEGSWLIEADAKEVEKLAKHIRRYKLRAKFNVRVLEEEERGVWSVWEEDGKEWTAHSLGGQSVKTRAEGEEVGCEDTRAPGMGKRLILPGNQAPGVEMNETSEDSYRIRRYLKGVPEGQDELIRESALPQESNIDFMGGIDYMKGCYVGQELTIRTHHTGVVRKRVLPVMLYGVDENVPDSLKYLPEKVLGVESIPRETSIGRVEKRGRSAGKWLSGVGNIGLGLCRLEIMTDVQVSGEAGGYKEGDEFKLEWDGDSGQETVKVKAFVPPWHLTKQ